MRARSLGELRKAPRGKPVTAAARNVRKPGGLAKWLRNHLVGERMEHAPTIGALCGGRLAKATGVRYEPSSWAAPAVCVKRTATRGWLAYPLSGLKKTAFRPLLDARVLQNPGSSESSVGHTPFELRMQEGVLHAQIEALGLKLRGSSCSSA